MSNNIPAPILEFARHRVKYGSPFVADYEGATQRLREKALNAISEYKEFKKKHAELEKEKTDIESWLKEIGHETGK